MQWHAGREHARGVPQPVQPDIADAQGLGRGADRPQCVPGSTAVPLLVVNTRLASTQIEAALTRSTAWLALTRPRAPQSRGRGARYGRERSVLGSLMNQVPVDP
jgi:hypothetical protein